MPYEEATAWHTLRMLESVRDNLKKREFEAVILHSKEDVAGFIDSTIPVESSVGLGGSVTVRQLEIDTYLKERGNTVFDHWDTGDFEESLAMRRKQLHADYFITSANAITVSGQLCNIDGIGNRVASMIFGPGHVISFVGINKVASNIDEALWRIRNIATPRNCKRLGLDTPCVKTGFCVNCTASTSVCRVTTILDYRPSLTKFTVALMPLELGF